VITGYRQGVTAAFPTAPAVDSQERQTPPAHRRCPQEFTHSTICESNNYSDASVAHQGAAFTRISNMSARFQGQSKFVSDGAAVVLRGCSGGL
jgi:hypothetical protein